MGWRIGCKETSRFRRRYLDEPRRMEIVRGGWKGCGEDSLTMLRTYSCWVGRFDE